MCTSHTVKQKGMDAKHENCRNSGFQLVVFQIILPFPVLINNGWKLVPLSSQTSIQDISEMHERQKRKSEFRLELKQLLPQAHEQWHTKWMFVIQWCGVLYSRNSCLPTTCKE
ncbi:uncharacterized protein TNIN_91071 [Trichonephila inaurata madagascariensis]|uniref:Uncharacterized protein n=1 Tax=Trichonephila inaurata madagascariensis TaxID=2747483 RepID=A0A8X6MLE8_9ARAC|nr:uncharacterized protein TNIN_91071 [Trichonephila inaurata madagascariensis]